MRESNRRNFLRAGAAATLSLAMQSSDMQAQTQRRVIIDTDPGVDDALAIFLALSSPEIKVEGITPVAGNVPLELTLPNALRLVEIAGRTDIPVAAGASHPLSRRLITATYAHGENGLGGVEFPEPKTKPVKQTASQLIREIVRKSPGEITLIAIGPLTNVATAFHEDPELPRMLRQLVIMGGSLSRGNVTPTAEFNIYVDPEAAKMVFAAGVPLTMVGLDVTNRTQLREEHIHLLEATNNPMSQAAGKITRAMLDRIRKSGGNSGPTMHDSLAVGSFLDPGVVTLRDYQIEIETAGEFTAGTTLGYLRAPVRRSAPPLNTANAPAADNNFHPNARVAVDLDQERFYKLLIGRITGKALA